MWISLKPFSAYLAFIGVLRNSPIVLFISEQMLNLAVCFTTRCILVALND